jgi:hypothetical protein
MITIVLLDGMIAGAAMGMKKDEMPSMLWTQDYI